MVYSLKHLLITRFDTDEKPLPNIVSNSSTISDRLIEVNINSSPIVCETEPVFIISTIFSSGDMLNTCINKIVRTMEYMSVSVNLIFSSDRLSLLK